MISFSFCNLNLTSGALLFEAMGTNERLRQVNICDSLLMVTHLLKETTVSSPFALF